MRDQVRHLSTPTSPWFYLHTFEMQPVALVSLAFVASRTISDLAAQVCARGTTIARTTATRALQHELGPPQIDTDDPDAFFSPGLTVSL